jgi:Repeat of Unknown Function (DUF347)
MKRLRWATTLAAVLGPVAWFAGMPAGTASAAVDPTATRMYLEPVSGTVHNGQTIDVKIYLDVGVADPLGLAAGDVVYPSNLLQCESWSAAGSAFETLYDAAYPCDDAGPDDGVVGLIATGDTNSVIGQHQLLGTIRFRADAVNDGTAPVRLAFRGSEQNVSDSNAFTYRPVTNTTEEVLDAVTNAEIRTK